MIDFQWVGGYTDFRHMAGTATTITLISSLGFGDIPPPVLCGELIVIQIFSEKGFLGVSL